MKKLSFSLTLSVLLTSCNNQLPCSLVFKPVKTVEKIKIDTVYVQKLSKSTSKKILLKKGDLFYFGYDKTSVTLYKAVDFNDTGVFACYSFQSGNDGGDNFFPFKDLMNRANFKILTRKFR